MPAWVYIYLELPAVTYSGLSLMTYGAVPGARYNVGVQVTYRAQRVASYRLRRATNN